MPPVAAIAGGIGSLLGGAAAGAAGLAGAAASAVGGAALGTAGLAGSAVTGLVSGVGSLFAGPAQTVGGQMAAISQPAYYETAGAGVLGGVASAASKTVGFLGEMVPAAAGIYSLIKPADQEIAAPVSYKGLSSVPTTRSPSITQSPLPVFNLVKEQPKVMTVGTPMEGKKDYMLYIGLAILAFLLLKGKK